MAYPVIRLDNMSGTTDGTLLRSVKFYTGADTAELNNGTIVELVELMEGEREVYKATAPSAANVARNKLVLVASPEKLYDERKKNLDDFTNEAGTLCRGYIMHDVDIFSLTDDGFTGGTTAAKGNVVEIAAGQTKMAIVATATADTTKIGDVIGIETVGTKRYVVVAVN